MASPSPAPPPRKVGIFFSPRAQAQRPPRHSTITVRPVQLPSYNAPLFLTHTTTPCHGFDRRRFSALPLLYLELPTSQQSLGIVLPCFVCGAFQVPAPGEKTSRGVVYLFVLHIPPPCNLAIGQ
jgi:hypothetical protein